MSNPWFKFYGGEYLSDPKISSLTPQERSCWITLLCLAGISSTPGFIEYLTIDALLQKSGIVWDPYNTTEYDNAKNVLEKLTRMKMISKNEEGVIEVLNWKKRQETNLTNAERQQRFRAKNSNSNAPRYESNVRVEESRVDKREISSEISSSSKERRVIPDEGIEERKPRARQDKGSISLREELYSMIEKDSGVRPTPSMADYVRILAALKHLSAADIKLMVEDAIADGKLEVRKTLRGLLTDREIDAYRMENV